MTLLSICKQVLAEVGWPVPVNIATNNDATAQQIFAIANTELEAISEEHNWPHLEIEYNFATVANQRVYAWPSDFRVPADNSVFNASQYYKVKGSMDSEDWHMRRYGLLANLGRKAYRQFYPLGLPTIELLPAPTGIENLVGTYFTSNFVVDQNGVGANLYMNDSDIARVQNAILRWALNGVSVVPKV